MNSLKFEDCFEIKPGEKGDLFQQFVYELFRKSDLPMVHRFPTKGKDGGIDLIQQINKERTVVECKYIADDADAEQRWRYEVRKNLKNNLGVTPKQRQYSPWYKTDCPIISYKFCISCEIGNQARLDSLEEEIKLFFEELAKAPHFSHLKKINIEVVDWSKLVEKLDTNLQLKFSWFPLPEKLGFIPIERKPKIETFRSFLEEENLPFYKRSEHLKSNPNSLISDEAHLLNKLESDSLNGLIITGNGGVGKTRLTFELGRLAHEKGWIVFRCRENFDSENIKNLPQVIEDNDKVLLLMDYIETQKDFAEIIENINTANEFNFHLKYVANCRTSYYPTVKLVPNHEQVTLTGTANINQTESIWIEKYQESVIYHILREGGITVTEKHLKVCKDRPILAVFILYLHKKNLDEDLINLLSEEDFGKWIFKRIKMSFARLQTFPINLDSELARLVAMFPCSKDIYSNLGDINRELLKILLNDGWIEESENNEWRNIHDVFADQILLSYIQENFPLKENLVREVLSLAYSLDCLESAFISLQRLAPYLKDIDWETLIKSEIDKELPKWTKIRSLLLESSIFEPLQKINLLQSDNLLWNTAESEIGFQNQLAWLIKWTVKENKTPLLENQTQSIKFWLSKTLPNVSISNFILNWGLRFASDITKSYAYDWISAKPALFQTHYLLVAWLELKLPTFEIQDYVKIWLDQFPDLKTTNFVYRAWLDVQGELELVRDSIKQWLILHQTDLEARFVYQPWLDAQGELDFVRDSIKQWLALHQTSFEARFIYQPWLHARGELDLVRDSIKQWLILHQTDLEAGFVYQPWLDAQGELDFVRDSIKQWLILHQTALDTQFVYKAWLNAQGELDFVRDSIKQWLALHQTSFEAGFIYQPWLHARGELELVRDSIKQWLIIHQTDLEARFVYQPWLDAQGELDLVRDSIKQWLIIHQTDLDTQFVYKAWLDARGELDLVRDSIKQWLIIHQTDLEADFVMKAWIAAKGELDLVRPHLEAWLEQYGTTEEADFVMRAWLNAKGDFNFVKTFAIRWLAENYNEYHAVFLSKELAKQFDLPIETVKHILLWCIKYYRDNDALWRLAQLKTHLLHSEISMEFVEAAEKIISLRVLIGKEMHPKQKNQINIIFFNLIINEGLQDAVSRQTVNKLLSKWLKHQYSFKKDLNPSMIIQNIEFFAKIIELFEENLLNIEEDYDALKRFLEWINNWVLENKEPLKPLVEYMKQTYPSDLWEIVELTG